MSNNPVKSTKEPNKDFKASLLDILEQHWSCDMGDGDLADDNECADSILAICKEMLVPAEAVDYEEETSPRGQTYYDEGFNDCRQHLLKQLGEKA